jgi:exopolysaccharide biosynthesis polyprenyl glycosylphosphotransferase
LNILKYFGFKFSVWQPILLAGDICLFYLSLIIALFLSPKVKIPWLLFVHFKVSFLLMCSVYLLVNYTADLYDYQKDYRRWWNVAHVMVAGSIGALANIVVFYFPLGTFVGRYVLLIQSFSFAIFITLWRSLFSSLALPERLQRRVIILGAGSCGTRILQALRNRPLSGFQVIGLVDDDPQKLGTFVQGMPVLRDSSQLQELINQYNIDTVVVAITHEKSPQLINTLTRVSWNGAEVIDMPSLYEHLAGKLPIDHLSDVWLLFNGLNKNKLYCRHLKRVMDLLVAGVLLVTHTPLLAMMAAVIKWDSPGPVFYRQERLGYEGRSFQLIKFRTMIQDAESNGPQWATDNDPRITRVGRFLRKFRLDELPQLINVLKGEMSIVGPRPEREMFIQEFRELLTTCRPGRRATDPPGTVVPCGEKEKLPYYSHRLLVKPGITGWAQVMYPYASSLEQTKEKLQYDLFYVKNIGFFLDMAILLKTVRIVLFGRGM